VAVSVRPQHNGSHWQARKRAVTMRLDWLAPCSWVPAFGTMRNKGLLKPHSLWDYYIIAVLVFELSALLLEPHLQPSLGGIL
jgi:hypothetical protein